MSQRRRILSLLLWATLAPFSRGAQAHAQLENAVPTEGGKATQLTEIRLTFSERLSLGFSGIRLTGADRQAVPLGDGSLTQDGKTLRAPLTQPLPPGVYSLAWHVLSVDGHVTQGTYRFTLTP